jgi:hypothetical protein
MKYFKKIAQYEDLTLKDHGSYLKYLLKHKASMISPGRNLGIPLSTLLKHDMDKFSKDMWNPYVAYFKGPKGVTGIKDPLIKKLFRDAVDGHYKRNLHHAHKMGIDQPLENQLEALADWYSVNKNISSDSKVFPSFKMWVEDKNEKLPLSREARLATTLQLGL